MSQGLKPAKNHCTKRFLPTLQAGEVVKDQLSALHDQAARIAQDHHANESSLTALILAGFLALWLVMITAACCILMVA